MLPVGFNFKPPERRAAEFKSESAAVIDAHMIQLNLEPLRAWPKKCASHTRRLIGRQSFGQSQKLIYGCLFCDHTMTVEEKFETKGYGRARKTLIVEER